MRLLRDLELSRKEAFEQLRKDKKERLGKEGILGATHQKRSKLQRFLSSMDEVIPKSSLIGKLKLIKFSMKIM